MRTVVGVIITSAFAVAKTYVGTEEVEGQDSNAAIVAMLREIAPWASGDEIPWCAAFVAHVARLLGLPRSRSLRARSWLAIGKPIQLSDAKTEEDVVVLSRGRGNQPGPEVIDAPGHVGWFAGHTPGEVHILGGNQGDAVTIARFQQSDVLGVRRLA